MGHILLIFFMALQALGVAAILRSQWRRGAYDDIIAHWRGMSLLMRALVVVLVSSGGAYAANKLLGNRLHEMLSAVPGTFSSLCTNVFTSAERQTGYAASAVRTNETHDLAMPAGAQMAERIARRGAHDDGFYFFDAYTNRLAHDGLDLGNPVWIHTDGTVTLRSPAPGIPITELSYIAVYSNITVYAPLQSSYGFLPASKWPDFMPSHIWTATTDRRSRVITWEGARLDRDVAQPVSFQAEFHDNGEVTYRYDTFPTNGVATGVFRNGTALAFASSAPQSLQEFLGFQDIPGYSTLQPADITSLTLSYIGDLGDGSGDADNDGLTDWEEVKRHHTDPREADTDGDGLVDVYEVQNGTDSFDPDEDGDGIADGATPAALASILAADAMSANLVLAFSSAAAPGNAPTQGQLRGAPPSGKGVFTVDGVPLLVTDGTVLNLSLPEDRTVDFKFLSRSRLGLAVSVSGNGTPVLADDEEGFFGGMAGTEASGKLLAATEFRIKSADDAIAGACVHEMPGTRGYHVILGDAEWEKWRKYAAVTGESADTEALTLHVEDEPSSSASLTISFPSAVMLVGGLSASVAIHRCEAGHNGYDHCILCGDHPLHAQGLSISPSRKCLGVGTEESATFSVSSDSYVQTPSWSLTPEVEGGPTLSINDGSVTVSPGTTTGIFTVTATGEGCSASATVVVYAVAYLTIESEAFPADQAVVQFPGMMPHPFNVTKSPVPDLHQPFFYKDAQTNFVVQPFTVNLVAHLTPDGVTDADIDCAWSLDSDDVEGTFGNAESLVAHFTPATGGGVYPFTFTCGSLPNSEAVLVLPLSGAKIDEIIFNDLAKADAFASRVMAKYTTKEINSPYNGLRWFYLAGKGDYRGRPNIGRAPTVWAYNQVNTSKWSGKYALGACGTVCGLPVRLSKLSNFMVGYACEKIGVKTENQMKSQLIGTRNDDSATRSWEAGVNVANGQSLFSAISNLVYSTWGPDEKVIRLWPNYLTPSNYTNPSAFGDPDFQFTSPGFLYLQDP